MESVTGSGAGGVGSDCEGEDQDEPSSSLSLGLDEAVGNLNLQEKPQDDRDDELSVFRLQWQRELVNTPSPQRAEPKQGTDGSSNTQAQVAEELQSDEDKAKQLFLRGVEFERAGKLYEAIQQYKKAMQILPDVETRLYESTDIRSDTPQEEESESEEIVREDAAPDSDDEDAVEGEELVSRLRRYLGRKGQLCEPAFPTKGAHISWLPYEVVLLLVRWVVSAELDAAALETLAAVCRGLYVAAREPDIWRSICIKTWGIDCGTPRAFGFDSWRSMYIDRPRLNLHGCYISKTSYLRHGENSFQDHFYRPWYLIDYYRYLRFFPDGVALMWTTAEEPSACVSLLRTRTPRPALGILPGHYRLVGDKVVIVVKKTNGEIKKPAGAANMRIRPRRKDAVDTYEKTYHLELEVRRYRAWRNFQLCWQQYSVSTRRDQWTDFELSASKFPPFSFSCVRSYTADTCAPLPNTHAYT